MYDNNFLEGTVPKVVDVSNLPVKVRTGKRAVAGTRVAATYSAIENVIKINRKVMAEKYKEKAWTKPKVPGVKALPENQFKTYKEWEDFIINHEMAHWKLGRQKSNETYAAYENRMNEWALNKIIKVTASDKKGYPARTEENVKKAAVTLQLAGDLNTAGEKLTTRLIKKHKKGRVVVNLGLKDVDTVENIAQKIARGLKRRKGNSLNIAGNGIYTLKDYVNPLTGNLFTQKSANEYLYKIIKRASELHPIKSIRSGGQSGIDEAGVIAGAQVGIRSSVLLPKDYIYRDIFNQTISDQKISEQRFKGITEPINQGDGTFKLLSLIHI